MLGVAGVVLRACELRPLPDTYDESVADFDPRVVSYWKFENSGVDAEGTQHATVIGSPELNVETIVDLDTIAEGAPADGECIAWPGTSGVYAEAAHNPAHKTAEGTIVVTFQRDSASQKSILVAADASAAAGGLSIEVTETGQPRAFLRRQSDGAPVILLGQTGDVELHEAYTLIFKWGPAGLSLALWDAGGLLVRRLTDPLSDGVTGSSPIRFGTWHTDVAQHDGPYGRVVWLSRRITDGEETTLARARTIAHGPLPGEVTQLGAWPLSELSGNTFADTVGGNTATLTVPSWTVATHENNRPGIAAGTDHSLEVSNGGPAIPMAASYKQSAMSLVLYVEPRSHLRGTQYWNTSDERHGREFLAYCDNGSTPGSFAIYRRRFSVTEWRLGGYVRSSGGVKQYFGSSVNGVSGALLPVDTAKRIVLAMGPAGAKLFLDASEVASLPGVTQGWTALTAAITLGSSSDTGHANDRSPLWGRLDQVEVWQGQLTLANVQARPAAAQSKPWRYPSDFVGGTTDINIANFSNNGSALNAALVAAAAAGRYVYQAEGDTTWYTASDQGGDNAAVFRPGCKGIINVRLRRPSNQNARFDRLLMIDNTSGQMGTTYGNPFAASGGWKFIGCQFDGNARGQNWHPKSGQPGFANTGFDLEHAHAVFLRNTEVNQAFTFAACDFMDGTGDAISVGQNTILTVKGCRFWSWFRGAVVNNALPATEVCTRCEMISGQRPGFGTIESGTGFTDNEPFGGNNINMSCYDCWADQDLDDESENGGTILYVNSHITGAAFWLVPSGTNTNSPVTTWTAKYCTFSYHSPGGNGGGTYPPSRWVGFFPMGGTGCLFDNCVFIANGDTYAYHDSWLTTPSNSKQFYIQYDTGSSLSSHTRLWTMRNCQWRAKNLPSGLATSNVLAVQHATMSTARNVELDGVTIDAAFADNPFNMGGITVRHRNVLHERTGDTTPWTNAGAVVPF